MTLERCRRELAQAHDTLASGHPEVFGLHLALEDWFLEGCMIEAEDTSIDKMFCRKCGRWHTFLEGCATKEEVLMQNPFTGQVRTFETGATRDTDEGKPVYGKFLSPLAVQAYGGYMHKHRLQADGSLRDGDNWKKGMPKRECFESLARHFVDLWLHMDGWGGKAREGKIDVLCALLFNVQILLHQEVKRCLESSGTGSITKSGPSTSGPAASGI